MDNNQVTVGPGTAALLLGSLLDPLGAASGSVALTVIACRTRAGVLPCHQVELHQAATRERQKGRPPRHNTALRPFGNQRTIPLATRSLRHRAAATCE
jgi:hypothetical protein